jgi:RND superfamily putative drug exporter
LASLTRWVLAHKRTVVIGWIVLTFAGIAASGPATENLENEFSVPDKEGWETNQLIAANYQGTGGDTSPLMPVTVLPEGESVDSPEVQADLAALDASLREALPEARIASYASTGDDTFVSDDGSTTYAVVYPTPDPDSQFGENPEAEEAASKAVAGATVAGEPVKLTGFDALFEDSGAEADDSGVLIEALVGGLGALLVLIFVFASFLALVPLLMAFCSIMTTFLFLYFLTEITTVSPIVQFLIALIGLGVAIDYSLLVVSRWREEHTHGADNEAAVQKAMETSGRAVVFSGITVAIGLLALIALPLPFLRSMGYGGMLIPLVSTLAAITLLPVVLAKFGPRLDWPHRRTDDKASRAWTRWATAITKRRWVAAGAGVAVILALALAATDMQLGASDANTVAKSGEAKEGLDALQDSGIGEGSLLPHEILVSGGTNPEAVARDVAQAPGVHGAVAPDAEDWRRNGTAVVEAIPVPDSGSPEGEANLEAVRGAAYSSGPDVAVGGQPAANDDFIDAVYGSFPLMILLITVTTFILLARAFRSLLLPAKAIVLNVLSVAAAWGVLSPDRTTLRRSGCRPPTRSTCSS